MDFQQVKDSYRRCSALGDEFFDSFYANLVDREIAIGQMFAGTDMRKQNHLIEEGIGQLIAFAEGNAQADRRIRELGRTHSRSHINVPPEFYPLWADSLMNAVKEHDPEFSPELEEEWRKIIAPGIERMVSLY